jgi:hypothetical protein
MSQIAFDEAGLGALALALTASAERLERIAASIRHVGLETGRAVAATCRLDAIAADRRQSATDLRRRARAARDEESRAVPRPRELPVRGPERRTSSREQIAAAEARRRLAQLRRDGGGSWGAVGVGAGWVRRQMQRGAAVVHHDTAFVKAVSDWETRTAARGLHWANARGRAVEASLPATLRPVARVEGSLLGGIAAGTLGGLVGTQAIFATNVDALGKAVVVESHGDAGAGAELGAELARADADYVRGAAIALGRTAEVGVAVNPGNPTNYSDFYSDVEHKGLTTALADDAQRVGEEAPSATLMLIGEPPNLVGRTAVTVGEAGAFQHGDRKLRSEDGTGKGH